MQEEDEPIPNTVSSHQLCIRRLSSFAQPNAIIHEFGAGHVYISLWLKTIHKSTRIKELSGKNTSPCDCFSPSPHLASLSYFISPFLFFLSSSYFFLPPLSIIPLLCPVPLSFRPLMIPLSPSLCVPSRLVSPCLLSFITSQFFLVLPLSLSPPFPLPSIPFYLPTVLPILFYFPAFQLFLTSPFLSHPFSFHLSTFSCPPFSLFYFPFSPKSSFPWVFPFFSFFLTLLCFFEIWCVCYYPAKENQVGRGRDRGMPSRQMGRERDRGRKVVNKWATTELLSILISTFHHASIYVII